MGGEIRSRRVARLFARAAFCIAAAAASVGMGPARAETLLEVYEAALRNDPQLKAAEANQLLGERRYTTAILRYFPRAYAQIDGFRTRQRIINSENTIFDLGTARYNSLDALVSVTQPIIDFERIAFIRRESAAEQRAIAEFAAARQQLVIRVVRRYLEALAARKRMALLKAAQDSAREELRRAKVSVDDKLITQADYKTIEARYQLARGELLGARTAYHNALEAIGEITGVTPRSVTTARSRIAPRPPEPRDPEQWVEMAYQGNPELQVQNFKVLEAERARDEMIARHLPRLELIGSYDYLDREGSQFGGGSKGDDAVVMLRLRIPLFNADGEGYGFRTAAAQREIEVHNFDRDRRLVAREVRNFYRLTATAGSRISALRQAADASRSALSEARSLQSNGLATSLDVLDAQRDSLRAERDLFDTELRYVLDYFSLLSLTGGVAEPHLEAVGAYFQG